MFLAFILAAASRAAAARADDSPISTSTPENASSTAGQVLGLQAPDVPQIITEIKNAKQLLSDVKLNYALSPVYKNIKNKKTGKTTRTLTGYNLWAKDIALAVLDPATRNVAIVKGMQEGKKMSFNDPAAEIKLKSFNGVNSKFQISRPENGAVIALKYLITGPESGSKEAIESALSEAIYVPSSPSLAGADVLKYGEDYLNTVIKQAVAELQTVPSQSFPGKMLTEAIRPALIKALVYAEHTDTSAILSENDEAVKNTINNLNVLFAANEGDAYKYSVSSAGARGIAQFMPGTYAGLAQRHPEAGLISDFVLGMSDHKNSIKAMYLLLDDYAGAVRAKASGGFAEGQIFDYGAASYNGGVTRVAKAVNMFGVNWNADQSNQAATLNAQAGGLKSHISSLASQIKKAKDKKTKTALQGELDSAKSSLAQTQNQLAALKDATLRNETLNYLKKIYKVIHIFNDQAV